MDIINPVPPGRTLGATFGVKFYRYRALLKRHWWIPAITIAIGLAYQGWLVSQKPDLYESTSQLSVSEELASLGDGNRLFRPLTESFVGNTVNMLQGAEVLRTARQNLELQAPDLSGADVDIDPKVIPRTSIFNVVGRGPDPEYTRRYVDAVVQAFIASRRQERSDVVTSASVELSSELARLRKEYAEQKAELDAFVEKNNMQFWKEQATSAASFLAGLKNRQARLLTEIQRLEHLTPEQLLNAGPAQQPGPRGADASVETNDADNSLSNELYAQYLQTQRELQIKRAQLEERSRVWKPAHPRLKDLKLQVDQLAQQKQFIEEQSQNAAEARAATIKAELASLEGSIESWTEKVKEASGKDQEFQRLEAAVTRTQTLQDRLMSGIDNLKIGKGLESGGLKVIQVATAPMPVPKGAMKHLFMGFFGGLLVGGGILFLLHRSDDRLASSSEMIEHFSEPVLGQIPNVADSRVAAGLPLLDPEDERYSYAEAFRSLRSSLIFMPNQEELKTLLITSAIPNEGKSTVASNLAITMSASGARVLLVDADLRRGDLAALFDTDGRRGLSNILRGEIPWRTTVQSTKHPTLSLIPRGPVTNQSGELLLKPILETILEEFKEEYDLVIFNTAPILATDDTPTLAPHFDGTLMVVRAQFTSARLTQNSLNSLYQRQVNVLGLILNCIDAEMPDYYYYQYPKYYAA